MPVEGRGASRSGRGGSDWGCRPVATADTLGRMGCDPAELSCIELHWASMAGSPPHSLIGCQLHGEHDIGQGILEMKWSLTVLIAEGSIWGKKSFLSRPWGWGHICLQPPRRTNRRWGHDSFCLAFKKVKSLVTLTSIRSFKECLLLMAT